MSCRGVVVRVRNAIVVRLSQRYEITQVGLLS
jgi:hypothetical protein